MRWGSIGGHGPRSARSRGHRWLSALLVQGGFEHVFLDEDRDVVGDAQGDGVGGAGVDVDQVAVGFFDVECGEEGVVGEVGDGDGVELGAPGR